MITGKFSNLSQPSFCLCEMWVIKYLSHKLLWEWNKTVYIKCLARCLATGKQAVVIFQLPQICRAVVNIVSCFPPPTTQGSKPFRQMQISGSYFQGLKITLMSCLKLHFNHIALPKARLPTIWPNSQPYGQIALQWRPGLSPVPSYHLSSNCIHEPSMLPLNSWP